MNIPEELIPVIDWWEKDGKKTLIVVAVALAAFAAYKGVVAHKEAKRIAAGDAVMSAYTTGDLESAVDRFAGMAAEGVLRLRLAKSYYDAGRYAEAKDIYESFGGTGPEGFGEIPVLGVALCQEALEQYDEAAAGFKAFLEANPESIYSLTAKLGSARIVALKGDRDSALKELDAVKEEVKDDELAAAVVDNMISTVKKFSPQIEAK